MALGVADHHDPRQQALRRVLRDHHADFAAVQLHQAADRKDADAADELLDEVRIEEHAAPFVEHADRRRG